MSGPLNADGLPDYRCITYCAIPYNGHGWSQSCASLLHNFQTEGLAAKLVLPRAAKGLSENIHCLEALPFPLTRLPWRLVDHTSRRRLDTVFRLEIAAADPARTAAYFWPGAPVELVRDAKKAGMLCIRQMINSPMGTAKRILDEAYGRLSMPGGCSISARDVACEVDELASYDYVFAPNPEVETSLREAGIAAERIVATSFGWSPSRFERFERQSEARRPLRFLFVGRAGVRKGVPFLLDAWKNAGVKGELVIVGDVEAEIRSRLDSALRQGTVRHVGYTDTVGAFYHNSDIFVFPTLEEGGPQVTLEAGGCGLPVITTRMGAGRLVRDMENGLIVDAGNVGQLVIALRRMAGDAALRKTFSQQISRDAKAFNYAAVSTAVARTILALLKRRAA